MINRDDVQLTDEELNIEQDFADGLYVPVQNIEEEKAKLVERAKQKTEKKKITIKVRT